MKLSDLYINLGINDKDFNNKMNGIKGKLSKFGSALTSAVKTSAKVVGAAAGATGAAVGKILKDSIDAYSEFEQLQGGIKLSLGEAYDYVADKAKNAYKTVQMSQNEYMKQVNQFSVGLKNSLEGDAKAAAELADKIITAQADIVAATGQSAEMVENAFVGVMRGNYTMLDNLSLGITPTKEGFQDMIDKVNDWNKAQGKSTTYTMGNLADMEAALVDYVSMQDMAGYAAREASETIQGSLAGTKAAWSNLLTDLANPEADVKKDFDNLFTMMFGGMQDGKEIKGLAGNLMPVFGQALSSLGGLVETKLPTLIEKIPAFIEKNLPQFLSIIGSVLGSIGNLVKNRFPVLMSQIRGWLKDNYPKIRDGISDILDKVIKWLSDNLPKMAGDLGEAIGTFLADAAAYIIPKLPEILGTLLDAALNFFTGIFDALDEKIPGLGFLLEGLTTIVLIGVGAWKAYQAAMAISNLINLVKGAIVKLTAEQTALNFAMNLNPAVAIAAAFVALVGAIVLLWNNCKAFRDFWIGVWKAIQDAMDVAVEAIAGWIGDVGKWFSDLWNDIKDAWEGLKQLASDVVGAIGGFFADIWNNMVESIEWVIGKIKELIGWIKEAIESLNPLKSARSVTDMIDDIKSKAGSNSGGGSQMYDPSSRYKHYAKAMDDAYLLNGATIFGEMGGSLLEGGERGQEMIVGTDYLAGMIQDAYTKAGNSQPQRIIIPVYIGNEKITEVVVNAQNKHNYVTGGR